jgi:hypothetical protein
MFLNILINELISKECIKKLISYLKLNKGDLIKEIKLVNISRSKRKSLSQNRCMELMSQEYKSEWPDSPGKCIFYHCSKNSINADKYHKHCGRISKDYICDICLDTRQGKKLQYQLNSGVITKNQYLNKCNAFRTSYFKTELKKRGILFLSEYVREDKNSLKEKYPLKIYPYNLPKYEFKNYEYPLYYSNELKLVLYKTTIQKEVKYVTIGIDTAFDGNVEKISIQNLRKLKNICLTVHIESLKENTLKYLENHYF